MATRTIESPGVEIFEKDDSLRTTTAIGTTVFATGYAKQGPSFELINITSKSELEQVYGLPTNPAERYFYQSCNEILNSNANLQTVRLPYGGSVTAEDLGEGFGEKYSGLFYPVTGFSEAEGLPTYGYLAITAIEEGVTWNLDYEMRVHSASPSAQFDSGTNISSLVANNTAISSDILNYIIPNNSLTYASLISGNSANIFDNTFSMKYIVLDVGLTPMIDSGTFTINLDGSGSCTAISNTNSDLALVFNYTTKTFTFSALNGKTIGEATNSTGALTGSMGLGLSFDMANKLTSKIITKNANYDDSTHFVIGTPNLKLLTENEYIALQSGQVTWASKVCATTATGLGDYGVIVLNEAKTTINDTAEGFYVSLIDNMQANSYTSPQYNSINSMLSITGNPVSGFIPTVAFNSANLGHSLTGAEGTQGSISEMLETMDGYDFSNPLYKNAISVGVLKFRTSNSESGTNKLYIGYKEQFAGSLDSNDNQKINPFTKQPYNFCIDRVANDASIYVDVIINPEISQKANWTTNSTTRSIATSLMPLGTFASTRDVNSKEIGNVYAKLEHALALAENKEENNIDLVIEAGLGTVFSYVKASTDKTTFDDTMNIASHIEALKDQNSGSSSPIALNYKSIYNLFLNFASQIRKDCLFIADPIRGVFVQGLDYKVSRKKTEAFSSLFYWPMKNLYGAGNSSYACTYANWVKLYDSALDDYSWLPFSGFMAAIMARMDASSFPWMAPGGLENGIVRNIVDIAVNPTGKQRDMLYKIGINPVVYFPGEGYVVWGQKTLQSTPSAFDRINVRRLFLFLEKSTLKLARYFVMEPNTTFTRTRVKNYLAPIFDYAQQNQGVYRYEIVCDERNNTPTTIDNNELHVSIYIAAVRTAEFVLVNFIATRTDANFNEIIG